VKFGPDLLGVMKIQNIILLSFDHPNARKEMKPLT
jgi:hypothetical protein